MTSIEVPDWVVEVAARVVAKNVGEDYDSLGPFTQDTIKATQRECITAALGAWVVPLHQIATPEPDWRDINAQHFRMIKGSTAKTRTLYDLR